MNLFVLAHDAVVCRAEILFIKDIKVGFSLYQISANFYVDFYLHKFEFISDKCKGVLPYESVSSIRMPDSDKREFTIVMSYTLNYTFYT